MSRNRDAMTGSKPVCVCVCFTRSSSSVNFWSQAWLLTGLQLVWPTTVLSSFKTALISSRRRNIIQHSVFIKTVTLFPFYIDTLKQTKQFHAIR